MTPEKRERAVKWLTEEVRSLRLAPKINGCGPENWAGQLEIMETCLEAVRNCNEVANWLQSGANFVMESEVMNRPFVRDITKVCECACADVSHDVEVNKMVPLTLEQLREMDGRPVWIERIGSDSSEDKEWALVFCNEKFCRTSSGNIALFGCYGIGWFAYAYPPAHIDREAWEPCRVCGQYEVLGFRGWRRQENMLKHPDGSGGCMYCPHCGRPRNDKAWDQLEKRLRG